ncbi:hypothetical protein KZZ52_49985 [Dactylosporangium sp. AC04546]|uniref:hypothetical protein n=1 Tax=Dactylosporangium sp. AC04546 TaxID=2862460 RepID=UPI001EDD131F|nr:hypothetical protein [Dactylosporangium sp. AC04546]WVK82015.1 hypothetical protein KZZ52_49985 [Dactylosporangium sp. AC04546]
MSQLLTDFAFRLVDLYRNATHGLGFYEGDSVVRLIIDGMARVAEVTEAEIASATVITARDAETVQFMQLLCRRLRRNVEYYSRFTADDIHPSIPLHQLMPELNSVLTTCLSWGGDA